jgi:hypothetical protein
MAHRILIVGLGLVALAFTLFGSVSPELAHAAPPSAPLGGTFTVNSSSDDTLPDGYLTLREAIMLANGGTGASGLNRALTSGEKAQLSGCIINGSNLITGGCGGGFADTIYFNVYPGVTLLS